MAASRERSESGFEPLSSPTPLSVDDLAALDVLVEGSERAEPEERLARAVIETRNLSHGFRQIAGEVRPALGWRAAGMATALDEAVQKHFGESL